MRRQVRGFGKELGGAFEAAQVVAQEQRIALRHPRRRRFREPRRAPPPGGKSPHGEGENEHGREQCLPLTLPLRRQDLDDQRRPVNPRVPCLRGKDQEAAAAFDAKTRRGEAVLHHERRPAPLTANEHQPLSRPNAACSARTASSAYFSSMRQLILISLVEMTRMFTPSSANTWNIFAATPAWLRMPTPTIETLAMPSS